MLRAVYVDEDGKPHHALVRVKHPGDYPPDLDLIFIERPAGRIVEATKVSHEMRRQPNMPFWRTN